LNVFDNLEAILTATFPEDTLVLYFFEQSNVPSPWNLYWTDATWEGGSLDFHDPVFGQHWTNYSGLQFGWCTNCDPEEACDWEGHNCIGVQSTIRNATAAVTIAMLLGILLIVGVPQTRTLSEIDAYNLPW
jgi:hypothetical protein